MRSDHHEGGRFRNPWPTFEWPPRGALLRWQWQRLTKPLAPNPKPSELPRATPAIEYPAAPVDRLLVTWVGHSTWLLQVGGLNVLTDPHWSLRASPFQNIGPRRFSDPGIAFEALPPIDLVLISHDHYDHLDDPTIRRIRDRFGERVQWLVPLGFERWFARRGIVVSELDWWEERSVQGAVGGSLGVTCLPAQHWTSRGPLDRMSRLWSSWAIRSEVHRIYFAGDSGWFPGYEEVGRSAGPFDLSILPIGAYEPRWFMKPSHMNPEEAVAAYGEMGGRGVFAPMHWGTFRLTDEDPLEPPRTTRQVWAAAGLPEAALWIPAIGETRRL